MLPSSKAIVGSQSSLSSSSGFLAPTLGICRSFRSCENLTILFQDTEVTWTNPITCCIGHNVMICELIQNESVSRTNLAETGQWSLPSISGKISQQLEGKRIQITRRDCDATDCEVNVNVHKGFFLVSERFFDLF